jgi:hypothetical protein
VILTTKTDQIRTAWSAGDGIGALRIAARFFDRSEATKAFKRGMDAHNNPAFYRQLGKDPDLMLLKGDEGGARGVGRKWRFSPGESLPWSAPLGPDRSRLVI